MDDTISVKTEGLRLFADKYEASSEVFNQAGTKINQYIISLLEAMPDYDGRLQAQAHADAQEINKWCKDFYNILKNNAELLIKTATAFEEEDSRIIAEYMKNIPPENNSQRIVGGFGCFEGTLDNSNNGEGGFQTPFYDPNADENGTVVGTLKILPPEVCEVEDDGGEGDSASGMAEFGQTIISKMKQSPGYIKALEGVLGQDVNIYLHYTRDSNNGFKINGVTVRNNSNQTIEITDIIISIDGKPYRAKVVGAPIFIHPGEVVDIKIIQENPAPWGDGATVTFRGTIEDSCNNQPEDLITLTIPPKT